MKLALPTVTEDSYCLPDFTIGSAICSSLYIAVYFHICTINYLQHWIGKLKVVLLSSITLGLKNTTKTD